MRSMYHELLMDHYRNPRNREKLSNPDFTSGQYNPSCGDAISIQGIVSAGNLDKLAFEGHGCVISQATASLLTQKVKGQSIVQVSSYGAEFVTNLIGISLGPTRLQCALLPLSALKKGLQEIVAKEM